VIYEHEELWWYDINRRKLLIHPSVLSGNPTNKSGAKGKGNDEFGLAKYFCSYFRNSFLYAVKLMTWGLQL
jgi:hypothetical protein